MRDELKRLLAGQTPTETMQALALRGVSVHRSTTARWHRGEKLPNAQHWPALVGAMLQRREDEIEDIVALDDAYRRGES